MAPFGRGQGELSSPAQGPQPLVPFRRPSASLSALTEILMSTPVISSIAFKPFGLEDDPCIVLPPPGSPEGILCDLVTYP